MPSFKKSLEFFVPVQSRPVLGRLSKAFASCGTEVRSLFTIILKQYRRHYMQDVFQEKPLIYKRENAKKHIKLFRGVFRRI